MRGSLEGRLERDWGGGEAPAPGGLRSGAAAAGESRVGSCSWELLLELWSSLLPVSVPGPSLLS